jgi:uncharacterized protein (DUF3820 family)
VDESKHLAQQARAELAEIRSTRMPFGKFSGRLLYTLPAEYLQWFAHKGWPKGRIGHLLQVVHQMKVDGSGNLLDPRHEGPLER